MSRSRDAYGWQGDRFNGRSNFGRKYSSAYSSRTSFGNGNLGNITLALVAAVIVIFAVGSCASSYSKKTPVTIMIQGKESVSTDDGHEYRVYTDQGTFKVGDSIVHPRFNCADVYGRLQEGKTYRCNSFGFRIPVLSSFKNLTDCVEQPK